MASLCLDFLLCGLEAEAARTASQGPGRRKPIVGGMSLSAVKSLRRKHVAPVTYTRPGRRTRA